MYGKLVFYVHTYPRTQIKISYIDFTLYQQVQYHGKMQKFGY